ncbi:uncharacterized protein PAC_15851 [Phialocephala subalpina]|uniref:Nephrocystin 3-like N-terminal domain-containing protein n=1 Tax=Phialocephala subalpina TaxID=576137 RepID=A0A1L7XLM0_9HELO|nr:uncharacterized protein PAC_15851 [Phialocephala subalpina]
MTQSPHVVLRPSEHAAPSTTVPPALPSTAKSSTFLPAVRPATSDTTLYSSLNNTIVKAAAEISQTATGDQAADIINDLAKDRSLWDIAYNALRKEKPDQITAYEDLLSRVPTGGESNSLARDRRRRRGHESNPLARCDRTPGEAKADNGAWFEAYRQDEQKADALLASLLKQLAGYQPSLPSSVKDLYDRHESKQTRPSLEEISSTLQSVATQYTRLFIIVDALDECQASNGCRQRFLSELFNLQAKVGKNVLVTSRFIPEITDKFIGRTLLEIRASEEDIRRYLSGHMSHLPAFVERSPDLQEEIITDIINATVGMYVDSLYIIELY